MRWIKLRIFLSVSLVACLGGCEKDDPEHCGNGKYDVGETCDGSILAAQSCQTQGFVAGNLACNATCDGYDTSGCIRAICGNGDKEAGEICDGDDLGGNTCTTLAMGFAGGDLACASTCDALDTSGCLLPDLGTLLGSVSLSAPVTCDASAVIEDCVGGVYVALFRNDPLVQLHQVPVASTVVLDAALSGDASEVAYLMPEVPVGTWYLAAFLDDNDNADLTAETPDAGDPVVTPFQVTVTVDATTTQDIELTTRMP